MIKFEAEKKGDKFLMVTVTRTSELNTSVSNIRTMLAKAKEEVEYLENLLAKAGELGLSDAAKEA